MRGAIPVYAISLPEYTVAQQPDCQAIGSKLDRVVETNFPGRRIALRSISLIDHPGQSLEDLVSIIVTLGTDRYDPHRKGPFHDFDQTYRIDLHALPCTVTEQGQLLSSHCIGSVMADGIDDFYSGPPVDRDGVPLRIDILMVYDWEQLEPIPIVYDDAPEAEPCAFRFKEPHQKANALLGVIKILSE